MTAAFQVEITQEGRSGGIVYRETGGEFSTWWEFAGGHDVVAFLAVPTPEQWDRQLPWATGRRGEILDRIGSEVIRQKASSCRYTIEDDFIYIVLSSSTRIR